MMEILNQQAKNTKKLLAKKPPPEKTISSAVNVQSWYDAVCLYDAGRIDEAIVKFKEVKKNARLQINIGCCYLRKNEVSSASEHFQTAVSLDPHMALGYFLLGLTNFLEKNFEKSMENFDKTLTLLRGNRFVDYKQLGLNYKLYSCEILTNKAVVAAELKNIEEAKNLLLQAFESKAEKKHDRIFDCVQHLQTGQSIDLFIPPQSEVFRPAKAAIQNVKKKDYLGASKVISTDSMDDCYACFSGIKEQVKTAKESKKEEPQEKKKVGPTRSDMLAELQKPNRRQTLRRVTPPIFKSNPQLGRVLNNSQDGPSRRYSLPPKTPLPKIDLEDHDDTDAGGNSGTNASQQAEQRFLGSSHDIRRSRSVGSAPRPQKPLPKLTLDENSDDKKSDAKILRRISLTKEPESDTATTSPVNTSTTSIDSIDGGQERKVSLQEQVIEEDISERQQYEVRTQPNHSTSPSSNCEEITVDVQFSFIRKIRLPKNYTLSDLNNAVHAQNIPKEVELCYNDEIGRQIVVTENSVESMNRHLSKENKLYCFPAR